MRADEPFANYRRLQESHYERLYALADRLGIERARSLRDGVVWELIGRALGSQQKEFRNFPSENRGRRPKSFDELKPVKVARAVDAYIAARLELGEKRPTDTEAIYAQMDAGALKQVKSEKAINQLVKDVGEGRNLILERQEEEAALRRFLDDQKADAQRRLSQGRRKRVSEK